MSQAHLGTLEILQSSWSLRVSKQENDACVRHLHIVVRKDFDDVPFELKPEG